ncbi:MAG: carbamoyltransferase C-terminal domain-containing protein, partial [Nitrososphaeraceae archaeon]
IKWIRNAIKNTGIRKLACAGGVFMNVKANMLILEMDEVDSLFIFPSGGDESLAIGAAYNVYVDYLSKIGKKVNTTPISSVYFGPSYSNEEIRESIKNLDDNYIMEYHDDINGYIAESIVSGDIIARFNGRMEFGARALGNRSILADPSKYEKVREINAAIKQRDFWMPFAPTILSEKQDDVIINSKNVQAPFMTLAFRTKESAHKELVSAIHPYDFTARPQVLEKQHNVSYYDLITQFNKLTGIPAILNTSFNLHGEPIVCTPGDAIRTLQNSGLQCLAIGNYFIRKRN